MNPLEVQHIRRTNLRRFIAENFDGSVNAFAKHISRLASFFYDALSGKRPLGEKIMRYIEDTFNLIRYELDRTEDGSFEHRRFELVKVFSPSLINDKLDGVAIVEEGLEVLPVSLDYMNRLALAATDLMWVAVSDCSMEPTLTMGSHILVCRQYQEIVDNKIYVLRKGKDILIRRAFIEHLSDNIIFQPDNRIYPQALFPLSELFELEIVGRALMKSAQEL